MVTMGLYLVVAIIVVALMTLTALVVEVEDVVAEEVVGDAVVVVAEEEEVGGLDSLGTVPPVIQCVCEVYHLLPRRMTSNSSSCH